MASADMFENPSAAEVKAIDDFSDEIATNIFNSINGNKLIRQTPYAIQMWKSLAPSSAITFNATSDGSNLTFEIDSGTANLQELVSRMYFTLSAGVTPGPLAPYFWYNKFSVVQGTTTLIREIAPKYLIAFLIENLPTELQNWLVDLAADQTAAVAGTVEQIMVWPLLFCSELITGISRPPIPINKFDQALTINFTPAALNKWCTHATVPFPPAATGSVVMKTYTKKVCYDPATVSSDPDAPPPPWHCVMKMPVFTQANEVPVTANTDLTVEVAPSNTLISDSFYFYFRSTTQQATAAGGNDYLHGKLPTSYTWNPKGASQPDGLDSKGMIKLFMRSQNMKGNMYNPSTTTSSLSLSTSENNFHYSPGPKWNVQDLLTAYKTTSSDKSSMTLQYDTAGTVTALPITIQVLEEVNGRVFFGKGTTHY